MHGISKEILKLVRASSALHAIADRSRRAKASFFDRVDRGYPEYDTEEVYFELLREIGRTVELRVVVDIIAGASAGGINGTMLARVEQVVHQAIPLGGCQDPQLPRDHGHRGAPEAFLVRALALVQAAARRARNGRSDVRRRDINGRGQEPPRLAAPLRPIARPVRRAHGLLRLSTARANSRSAADP